MPAASQRVFENGTAQKSFVAGGQTGSAGSVLRLLTHTCVQDVHVSPGASLMMLATLAINWFGLLMAGHMLMKSGSVPFTLTWSLLTYSTLTWCVRVCRTACRSLSVTWTRMTSSQ
jgi:hypothetical protein